MKYYDSIIEKIINVISKSEQIKNNISIEELNNNYNNLFVKRLGKDIYIDYINEFDSLLDQEETCYSLLNDNNKYNKNRELYSYALSNLDNYLYAIIVEILRNVSKKPFNEVTMFNDYFICIHIAHTFI